MRIAELIAIAKIRSGKEQQQMATEMAITASRLSAIAKGKLQPNASEVAYLAQQAQTDPLKAIADIESEREPKFAPIWAKLLSSAPGQMLLLVATATTKKARQVRAIFLQRQGFALHPTA